ncbi:hypothetical protein ACFL3K_01310 [Pseudomonadota bacterium]
MDVGSVSIGTAIGKSILDIFVRNCDNERKWLENLREKVNQWYNEMTEPLLPITSGQVKMLTPQMQMAARGLYEKHFLHTAGSDIRFKMQERELDVLREKDLLKLVDEYLAAGSFIKDAAYSGDINGLYEGWQVFTEKRGFLNDEINARLRGLA